MSLITIPQFIVEIREGKNVIKQLICESKDIQSYAYEEKILVLVDKCQW